MFNQENRDMHGNQYNAANDIHHSQNYYQPDNRVTAGRDIKTSHIHHRGESPASILTRGAMTIVGLLLVGVAIYFSYPSLKGFMNNLSTSNLFDTSKGLDKMVYGTPKKSLDEFCNQLRAEAVQGAYDEYSDHLKSQISPDDFANIWGQPGESVTRCVDNIINTSGTSATGKLDIATRTIASTGVTDNHVGYNVTMVTSDGIWKIDALTHQ